ncbi:hypothetical protein Athai_64920 [Actinocatenispora thailandica]|uniref:Mycothiol-dependent maleylpyruvate isomerase metal-binding domain-containing protein n=1 Tax=Actinocatenispora thailandica TaxID=227318 RepID=A0A7R7I0X5_9ACTN|nr:maleylpyruvate isomerase N-terminal domain-containing protein [Actinocatenispora thailandica]BCJ38989.1 hypothetical protein Athai_64920 [Actinocatenispora thailandica]
MHGRRAAQAPQGGDGTPRREPDASHGHRPAGLAAAAPEPGPTPAAEPTAVTREQALAALTVAYRQLTVIVRERPDADLIRPSRCTGWSVLDVLYHVLLDAQRALIALATPDDRVADTDYISYWRSFPASPRIGANEHARAVRIAASAFRPRTLIQLWEETSAAVVHAARAADADLRLSTQQHVLTLPDLLATLAVEACVHGLDMTVELAAPTPDPLPLELTRRTLDGLLGAGVRRPGWTDRDYVLKGTGRSPLSATERELLGPSAAQFPLFA